MSSMILIFFSAGVLAVIAIALAVVNWVYLASISSRMAELDSEIRKKTIEFDALRKELHQVPLASPRQREAAPAAVAPAFEETGQIQIFRNVRKEYVPENDINVYSATDQAQADANAGRQDSGAYRAVEAASPEDTTVKQVAVFGNEESAPPLAPEPRPTTAAMLPLSPPPADQIEHTDNAAFVETNAGADAAEKTSAPCLPEMETDILDVVSAEEPPAQTPVSSTAISVVPLYSPAKKDADFVAAWKLFGERLSRQQGGSVHLDLGNILFLYDKEVHYLEQMAVMAAKYRTELCFINCSSDVARVLGAQPRLAPLLKTA